MKIDQEIDHGPVLASREFSISNFQFSNHNELAKGLFELGAKLLIEILPKYLNGEIKAMEQDHGQATFTKTFKREDGRINWSESGDKIYNRIRALNPEPGTWTTWKGKILNILKTELLICDIDNKPGLVIKLNGNVAVAIKKCYLILRFIQLEGGKEMDAQSFINGHPDFLGSQLD